MLRLLFAAACWIAAPVRTSVAFAAAIGVLGSAAGCQPPRRPTTPTAIPTPQVQVGSCATPGRDGVIGAAPVLDRADRDLNGDGTSEAIVVDRSLCSAEGNCHWNVFVVRHAEAHGAHGAADAEPAGECARFAGTFEGSALEPLATRGDDNMADVRGYWNLHGGRLLLQSYRFTRGGYRLVEALVCKRGDDDRLDCADTEH